MGYRIAIDTGGTFTDVVLADEERNFLLGKAPTDNQRIFVGSKPVGQAKTNCRKPEPAAEQDQGYEDRAAQFTINLWQEILPIFSNNSKPGRFASGALAR